jgi:hypothetical protein
MEEALVKAVTPATTAEVAAWLKKHGNEYLEKHDKAIATEEASWRRKQTYPGTSGSRRTPIPGSLRTLADGSRNGTIPPAPQRRGPYILITILAMLVGGLAIGVVFLMRDGAKNATASPAPSPSPSPSPSLTNDHPVVEPKLEPAVAAPGAAEPTVADESPAEPAATPTEEAKPVAETAKAPATQPARPQPKKTIRAQPQAQPKAAPPVRAAKPVDVTPTTPAPAPAPAAKADNCNPPYYFEGTKKIFKPQCL